MMFLFPLPLILFNKVLLLRGGNIVTEDCPLFKIYYRKV
jgi:hypothetical protein